MFALAFKREITMGQVINLAVILVGIVLAYGHLEGRVARIESDHVREEVTQHDLASEVVKVREMLAEVRTELRMLRQQRHDGPGE